jgi:hypothetical protein
VVEILLSIDSRYRKASLIILSPVINVFVRHNYVVEFEGQDGTIGIDGGQYRLGGVE